MDSDPDPGRADSVRSVLLLAVLLVVPVCGAFGVLLLALGSVWWG